MNDVQDLQDRIAAALRAELPRGAATHAAVLASVFADVATGRISPQEAVARLAPVRDLVMPQLAGREVTAGNVGVSFGSGNQFGTVTISGDVAGRDIIKINISAVEQAYDVHGFPNPYLGLKPFTYKERERFAGRDRLIIKTRDKLTTPGKERTLLFITGDSGSGKSSLVQAGLLPALKNYYHERQRDVYPGVMHPGEHPLVALDDALQQIGLNAQAFRFANLLRRSHRADQFTEVRRRFERLGRLLQRQDRVAILIIDQFEELFAQSDPEERDALIAFLETLPPFTQLRAHVVATLRVDYIHELYHHQALYDMATGESIKLRAMEPDELREAIQRPLQQTDPEKRFEPALLDRLVADAAGEAAYLPLLQVTLEDLWRRGSLRLANYQGLSDAISRHADAVCDYADHFDAREKEREPAERDAILPIFLELMLWVAPDGDSRDDSRREHQDKAHKALLPLRRERRYKDLTTLDPTGGRLINELIAARLLSTSGVKAGTPRADTLVTIIHDELIARWERLRRAIDDHSDELRLRARFDEALREWEQHRNSPNDYLLRGIRMTEARELDKRGYIRRRGADAAEFFEQSLEREKNDLERERELRGQAEAALKREQEVREQAEASLKREQEARAGSESQRLAFIAQSLLDTDARRETTLLLACEAVLQHHNPQSEQVLRDALDRVTWQVSLLPRDSRIAASDAVFSPNGRYILTIAEGDDSVHLWSSDGKLITRLHDRPAASTAWRRRDQRLFDEVFCAAFSPDSQHILAASSDGVARLWTINGELLARLQHTIYKPEAQLIRYEVKVRFSPDGRLFLTLFRGDLRLWDMAGQQLSLPVYAPSPFNSQLTYLDARRKYADHTSYGQQLLAPENEQHALKKGHTDTIDDALFSPDGQQILTIDGTAHLWDLSGQLLNTIAGHYTCAAFSLDGQRIAMGWIDYVDRHNVFSVRLWSIDGQLLHEMQGHTLDVNGVAFRKDGQRILTFSSDATARLWDTNGQLVATLETTGSLSMRSAVFSSDGQILTATRDGIARLWDMDGNLIDTLVGHQDGVSSAVFSPDGKRILTTPTRGVARLWEKAGPPLPVLEGHVQGVRSGTYLAGSRNILTSSWDGTTQLWDETGRLIATMEGTVDSFDRAVLSADGRYLLTIDNSQPALPNWIYNDDVPPQMWRWYRSSLPRSGRVHLWQLLTIRHDSLAASEPTAGDHEPRQHPDELLHVLLSNPLYADEQLVDSVPAPSTSPATGEAAHRLVTLALPDPPPSTSPEENTFLEIKDALLSPNGQRILKAPYLWDSSGKLLAKLAGQKLPQVYDPEQTPSIDFALFGPDNQRILTASQNGMVWLWDMDGQLLTAFLVDDFTHDNLFSVAFRPDGRRILTTVRKRADIWDRDGQHVARLQCHTNKVRRGLFSPDGQRILTVSESAIPDVRLWDGEGNLIADLATTVYESLPIAFRRDSACFCACESVGVRVWDANGRSIATLRVDVGVRDLKFSPDGQYLLIAQVDGTAQLWNYSASEARPVILKGHKDGLWSASFSQDGRRILTTSADGTARQYLVDVDELLNVAACRLGRNLTSEEIEQYQVSKPIRFALEEQLQLRQGDIGSVHDEPYTPLDAE